MQRTIFFIFLIAGVVFSFLFFLTKNQRGTGLNFTGDQICFGFINMEKISESRQELISVHVNLMPKGDARLLFLLKDKRKLNLRINLPDSMYSSSVSIYEFDKPLSSYVWNMGDFARIASTKWEAISGDVTVDLTASPNIEEGKKSKISLANIVLKSEKGNHKKKISKIVFQNLKILDSRANYLEKIDKTETDHILSTSGKQTK